MTKPKRHAEWYVKKSTFVFDDAQEYEKWKQNPKVYFHFNSSDSDDGGASVLEPPIHVYFFVEITPENGDFSIVHEENGPCISAGIAFPFDLPEQDSKLRFKADLDQDALHHWSLELNGEDCGSIELGVDSAIPSDHEAAGWLVIVDGQAPWEISPRT